MSTADTHRPSGVYRVGRSLDTGLHEGYVTLLSDDPPRESRCAHPKSAGSIASGCAVGGWTGTPSGAPAMASGVYGMVVALCGPACRYCHGLCDANTMSTYSGDGDRQCGENAKREEEKKKGTVSKGGRKHGRMACAFCLRGRARPKWSRRTDLSRASPNGGSTRRGQSRLWTSTMARSKVVMVDARSDRVTTMRWMSVSVYTRTVYVRSGGPCRGRAHSFFSLLISRRKAAAPHEGHLFAPGPFCLSRAQSAPIVCHSPTTPQSRALGDTISLPEKAAKQQKGNFSEEIPTLHKRYK